MSAKLYFKYGVMGAGKSLDLIRTVYNYRERGMEVLVFKPLEDTRDGRGLCFIKSRTGDLLDADWLPKNSVYDTIELKFNDTIKAIFIDEAQFLDEDQIQELQSIMYDYDVPIICYGILTDFQSHLFPGSKRLMELADDKQELIGICWCGKKAKQNARIVNGKMETEGEVIKIGDTKIENMNPFKKDTVYYVALCNECYKKRRLSDNE